MAMGGGKDTRGRPVSFVCLKHDGDLHFRTDHLFEKLVSGFNRWPKETLREHVEEDVISLGFTKEDIAFLRDWLLEP